MHATTGSIIYIYAAHACAARWNILACLVDVSGEDSRGQAVLCCIGPSQHPINVTERERGGRREGKGERREGKGERECGTTEDEVENTGAAKHAVLLASPILKDRDNHDWPKGFLHCQHHVILDIGEDRGLHEEAWTKRGRCEHTLYIHVCVHSCACTCTCIHSQ